MYNDTRNDYQMRKDIFRTKAECLSDKVLPEIYRERSRRRGGGFNFLCNFKV